jgi:ribosomal protein L37AE/L43A
MRYSAEIVNNQREILKNMGRATAQEVSCWLPNSATRVRSRVWSCGICGGQSGTGSVSPSNLHSTNCSTLTIIYHLGLVQYASSGRSTKWTQSQISMPWVTFEPTIQVFEVAKSVHALDRAPTVIGRQQSASQSTGSMKHSISWDIMQCN